MQQSIIDRAYNSLINISKLNLPIRKAYQIYKLIKTIEEPYTFGIEQKKKALQRFGGQVQLDGQVVFANEQNYLDCLKELNNIDTLDIEISIEPIYLSAQELNGQMLTPMDILNLESFIVFEEVE